MADKKKNPVTEGKKSFNWPDKIFGAAVLILSILVFLIIAYPLWFIIIASISNSNMVNLGKVTFLPKDIRFYGYQQIMDDARIWMGYANTILYVVAGTILNMAVTMPAAYALSRRNFKARNKVMFYFVFTMFFSGGLVPLYMTVSSLGLISTKTILIIFVAVNTYNLIIARTFIENSIPEDLYEAAVLDGCSHFNYFVKVVLPLSKAVISVLILYYAVFHWNDFFNALLLQQCQKRAAPDHTEGNPPAESGIFQRRGRRAGRLCPGRCGSGKICSLLYLPCRFCACILLYRNILKRA
ncbi:MAG: carbohydrate ABC transporter permease [Eisenbergiella sp.]